MKLVSVKYIDIYIINYNYIKTFIQWVPRILTEQNKDTREIICYTRNNLNYVLKSLLEKVVTI